MAKKADKKDEDEKQGAGVVPEAPEMSDEELKEALGTRPAAAVTPTFLDSRVALSEVEYTRIGKTITICTITLPSGYSVMGESACVKEENFDEEIGKKIAYDNAYAKLWPLYGFLLAELGGLPRKELEAVAKDKKKK